MITEILLHSTNHKATFHRISVVALDHKGWASWAIWRVAIQGEAAPQLGAFRFIRTTSYHSVKMASSEDGFQKT